MSQPPYPPQPHQPQAGPWQPTPPPQPGPWQTGPTYGQPAQPSGYPPAATTPSPYGPPGAAPHPQQPQPAAPYQQQPQPAAPYQQQPYGAPPNPYPPTQQPYGAPTNPYPPAAAAQPRRSRTGKILLVVLPLVLLLCVGGGTVAFLTLTGDADGTTPHGPSADGTTAPPSDGGKTASPVQPNGVRLVMPARLGPRPKVTDMQDLADEFATGLKKAVPGTTQAAGAAYGNRATKDVTIVWAAAGDIADPDQALEKAFDGLRGSQQLDITAEPVDPGPLGGRARCATVREQAKKSVVCAWADRGSVGIMMNLTSSLGALEDEFPAIRVNVEQLR